MNLFLLLNTRFNLFKTYERTQFPLVLAYALTVHKSQGMTLNKVRVSLGSSDGKNRGMAYVALSRVTDIRNLLGISQWID